MSLLGEFYLGEVRNIRPCKDRLTGTSVFKGEKVDWHSGYMKLEACICL